MSESQSFRLTHYRLRDLLLFVAICGLGLAWWVDRNRLQSRRPTAATVSTGALQHIEGPVDVTVSYTKILGGSTVKHVQVWRNVTAIDFPDGFAVFAFNDGKGKLLKMPSIQELSWEKARSAKGSDSAADHSSGEVGESSHGH